MLLGRFVLKSVLAWTLAITLVLSRADAACCVWRVTGPTGTLYLGGSYHVLRSIDYPLPSAYNRAFEASTRLVFEADPRDLESVSKGFLKEGVYPKGDSLRNHVDPRTYDYLRRL